VVNYIWGVSSRLGVGYPAEEEKGEEKRLIGRRVYFPLMSV